MAIPVFDTLKAAKSLQAAGFDERQAEAVVATVGGAVEDVFVTRADLQSALQPFATRKDLAMALEAQDGRFDKKLESLSASVDQRLNALSTSVDQRLETMSVRFDEKLDALSNRVDTQIRALDAKILSLDQKFEAELATVARQTDLAQLQHTMTVRLGGMMAAGIGLLAVIVGLF